MVVRSNVGASVSIFIWLCGRRSQHLERRRRMNRRHSHQRSNCATREGKRASYACTMTSLGSQIAGDIRNCMCLNMTQDESCRQHPAGGECVEWGQVASWTLMSRCPTKTQRLVQPPAPGSPFAFAPVISQFPRSDFVVAGDVAGFHIATSRVIIYRAQGRNKTYHFLSKGAPRR
jgi:hypothetical protein